MTELAVKIMGEPNLIQPSQPVAAFDQSIEVIVKDLKDTMKKEGGVAIAAPQVGVNQRIIVFGFSKSDRYPEVKPVPFTVLINPEYEVLSNEMEEDWEGCLSIPGLRGLVPRYRHIKYRGYDEKGNALERVVDGFHARIIQHEVDHLDGALFLFRMTNLKSLGFEQVMFKKSDTLKEA